MVMHCCAYGCKETFAKGGTITFHSFPKDVERRKVWEVKLRRENFKVTNYSKICSKHFAPDCFDTSKLGGTWLKPDAVPTIFEFPKHLQNVQKNRKPAKKRLKTSEHESADCKNEGLTAGSSKRKRKRLHYLGDFDENDVTSPSKAKKMLQITQTHVSDLKHTIRNLNRKNKRLKKRVVSLVDVVNELERKNMISDAATSVLKLSLPGAATEFLHRLESGGSKEKYSPELKAFALTLHFYSAKAYDYVRKTFNCNLPHPTTLRKWYQGIDGNAGFTREAFVALKAKAEDAKLKNSRVKCCLIIDEMAIRNHVEWDRNKFSGFVDLGTDLDDDSLPHAKDALVFMVNALNSNWKVPIGYFLINGLTARERANLIYEALCQMHEAGIDVECLTFDGTSCNIATANALGASLVPDNSIHFFPHPVTNKNVNIIMDACHMLKLVRNCLASKGSVYDPSSGLVNWRYVVELEKIQNEQGLHLATKLRTRHIQWYREKMKVKLAAQVMSGSVADALEYLAHDLKHPDFQGCEPTVIFLRMFNDLFDLLNSKNFLGKGYKSPFQIKNKECFVGFLGKVEAYIKGLKTAENGILILHSNRKTGFLGFLVTLNSVKSLYFSLCENSLSMKFLLTYKLSQDHLELFFSAVRTKGGHNNNPTAKQFKAAYVRLLAHHDIMTSDSANCSILDQTNILNLTSSTNMYLNSINATQTNLAEIEDFENLEVVSEDHTYHIRSLRQLSDYVVDVVGYIAGFVVRKLTNKLKCSDCISAIILDNSINPSKLLLRKNRGGLILPSLDVTQVCKLGEKVFRICHASGKLVRKNIMHLLIIYGLNEIVSLNCSVFADVDGHSLDQAPLDNHRIFIIKAIFYEYFKIRLTHAGKGITEKLQANKVRSINSKATIFKGQ